MWGALDDAAKQKYKDDAPMVIDKPKKRKKGKKQKAKPAPTPEKPSISDEDLALVGRYFFDEEREEVYCVKKVSSATAPQPKRRARFRVNAPPPAQDR
jgi:hypothetical protein